jgi:hypothetical protein
MRARAAPPPAARGPRAAHERSKRQHPKAPRECARARRPPPAAHPLALLSHARAPRRAPPARSPRQPRPGPRVLRAPNKGAPSQGGRPPLTPAPACRTPRPCMRARPHAHAPRQARPDPPREQAPHHDGAPCTHPRPPPPLYAVHARRHQYNTRPPLPQAPLKTSLSQPPSRKVACPLPAVAPRVVSSTGARAPRPSVCLHMRPLAPAPKPLANRP